MAAPIVESLPQHYRTPLGKWFNDGRELSVGLPSDPASEKSWDVSLVMRFASQAELEAALASSVFAQYVDVELAGKCQVTKAWSFARIAP